MASLPLGTGAKNTDMRSIIKWAAIVLAIICMGAAALLGWKILHTEHEYQAGISAYDQIAEIAGVANGTENQGNMGPGGILALVISGNAEQADNSQTSNTDVKNDSEKDDPADNNGVLPESEVQDASTCERPPDLPEINFKAMKEMNPDVIGWLYCPDTAINYPVVQGNDNAFYLKHLADGMENSNGCPFLDVQNRPDFTDDNSIIYGHHMKNGTMFASISWYEDQDYYEDHPIMYLMTPSATYQIKLFSGYITTMNSSAYMQTLGSIREHTNWLKEVSGKSDFKANLEISAYDRVITLSTCAYNFENARYVLHGKTV